MLSKFISHSLILACRNQHNEILRRNWTFLVALKAKRKSKDLWGNPIHTHNSFWASRTVQSKFLDQNDLLVAYSKYQKPKLWSPLDSPPKSGRSTPSERRERAFWSLQSGRFFGTQYWILAVPPLLYLTFSEGFRGSTFTNDGLNQRANKCHDDSGAKNMG